MYVSICIDNYLMCIIHRMYTHSKEMYRSSNLWMIIRVYIYMDYTYLDVSILVSMYIYIHIYASYTVYIYT